MSDILCPVCSADLALSGEEEAGDVLMCTCCSSPILVKTIDETGDPVLVEDF
jgi:DNA-directed RNA polymerase subunit RPC12/RpoP